MANNNVLDLLGDDDSQSQSTQQTNKNNSNRGPIDLIGSLSQPFDGGNQQGFGNVNVNQQQQQQVQNPDLVG